MLMEVSKQTYKTLRKLIPYGQENIDKQLEFRDESSNLNYTISVCRHPRGSLMLRVTEKGPESAKHSFFGLAVPNRTNISLWAYSMAVEDLLMPLDNPQNPGGGVINKIWKFSSEAACPRFPDFEALDIIHWDRGKVPRNDQLSYGAYELSDLAEALGVLMAKAKPR